MRYIMIENHPADSRVKIKDDGICQSLTSRMDTGGGNVPLVLCFTKSRRAQSKDDYETWVESDVSNTINTFDMGDVRSTTVVIHESNFDRQMESDMSRGSDVDTPNIRRNRGR